MEELKVSVLERIGHAYGISEQAGQGINNLICAALKNGNRVNLSFLNISMLTTSFLNAAIGQLYGMFSVDYIKSMLIISDMQHDDIYMLQCVVDNAKEYFKKHKEEMV